MSVVTVLPKACDRMKSNIITPTNSMKSMETIYSITPSSKFSALTRRKVNAQKNRDRNPVLVPAVSEIKQRVMSARMLRTKQLQNQISEAHHRIADLTAENRLLKSLHKRQDSALSKYESSNAELPQLLHSHAEELRMWQTRCRNIQRANKDLQMKIKQKDALILALTDQNKHFMQLNKDKSLQERAMLQERVKDLEQRCMDKENELRLLARRLQLEAKAYKSNLNLEQQKYREMLMKMEISDFLTDNNKKSTRSTPKSKSPSNRLMSKSASNLSQLNGDHKDHLSSTTIISTTTTTLPPCSDSMKKNQEILLKNNSPSVMNNDKINEEDEEDEEEQQQRVDDYYDEEENNDDEIDLTKNCIDKSDKLLKTSSTASQDDADSAIKLKNSMHRVRQQQKTASTLVTKVNNNKKLTPLHPQQKQDAKSNNNNINKHEKKSKSSDSEFSDDDFHFFTDHNGTKMAAPSARELLDHKMHLTELETKMKQNSLDLKNNSYGLKTSNSSLSSQTDADERTIRNDTPHTHLSFNDRGDSDIISIQRELRESMMHRESILDEYCDTLVDKNSNYSGYSRSTITNATTKVKKLEFGGGATEGMPESYKANNYHKSNGHANNCGAQLDQKKKTKLLAALKHIDNGSSVEN